MYFVVLEIPEKKWKNTNIVTQRAKIIYLKAKLYDENSRFRKVQLTGLTAWPCEKFAANNRWKNQNCSDLNLLKSLIKLICACYINKTGNFEKVSIVSLSRVQLTRGLVEAMN